MKQLPSPFTSKSASSPSDGHCNDPSGQDVSRATTRGCMLTRLTIFTHTPPPSETNCYTSDMFRSSSHTIQRERNWRQAQTGSTATGSGMLSSNSVKICFVTCFASRDRLRCSGRRTEDYRSFISQNSQRHSLALTSDHRPLPPAGFGPGWEYLISSSEDEGCTASGKPPSRSNDRGINPTCKWTRAKALISRTSIGV